MRTKLGYEEGHDLSRARKRRRISATILSDDEAEEAQVGGKEDSQGDGSTVDDEEEQRRLDDDFIVPDDEEESGKSDNGSYYTESDPSHSDSEVSTPRIETETPSSALESEEDDVPLDVLQDHRPQRSVKVDRNQAATPTPSRESTCQDEQMTENVPEEAQQEEAGPEDALGFITRLINTEKRDILILDEDDTYSITLTLACLRGSYNGLWCSRYDNTPFRPGMLADLLRKNRSAARARHTDCVLCKDKDAPLRGSWYDDMQSQLSQLELDDYLRFDLNFWANQLSSHCPSEVPKSLIWLNFPYIQFAGREPGYLQSFLFDCFEVQNQGDTVLVTLTNDPMWYDQYDVPGLLELARRLGYEAREEHTFVRDECQHFGYHHRTYKRLPQQVEEDIHEYVVPDCTIYIFVKGPNPHETPSRSWIQAKTCDLPFTTPRPQHPWPYARIRPTPSSARNIQVTPQRSTVQLPPTPPSLFRR